MLSESDITNVLSCVPRTAKEICEKLNTTDRITVNRHLYKLSDEKTATRDDATPPKWKAMPSTMTIILFDCTEVAAMDAYNKSRPYATRDVVLVPILASSAKFENEIVNEDTKTAMIWEICRRTIECPSPISIVLVTEDQSALKLSRCLKNNSTIVQCVDWCTLRLYIE